MKEDEWKKLYEKYKEKFEKPKRPMPAKKILTMVSLITAAVSILLVFFYFTYFALPMYDNVNMAVMSMIESESDVKLGLSGLPTERCYWIRPMYNESGHFVEIIEYRAESRCIGVTTNKTVLQLASALNIRTSDCICGKNSYTMEKTLDKYGINLKLVAK